MKPFQPEIIRMNDAPESKFWQYDAHYWFERLNSSELGLTHAEVRKKVRGGRMVQTRPGYLKDFYLLMRQFKSPLMLLLIAAVIVSAFLGESSDVFIILFILLSSGLLSFIQERSAGKVVEKLNRMVALKANLMREGRPQEIASANVVSGDIVLLKAGDMLPADCLLLEANELYANESSLTGESYPARKNPGVTDQLTELAKRTNCLWEGTSIISGTGKALAIQTGEQTIYGTIAKGASEVVESTFEKGIREFGFLLTKITLWLAASILFINLANQKGLVQSALFALALAVGMAPELLPAITTIAMSAGARRLLDKKVIVKKLNSIQNLGEVNMVCTDKTGTITEGTITVSGLVDGFNKESSFVKQLAFWNASLETGYANPIDQGLRKLEIESDARAYKVGEVPYDFLRKRLSIAVKTGSETLFISKGAVDQILAICTKIRADDGTVEAIDQYKANLQKTYAAFGIQGLRAIGVCYKNIGTETVTKALETDMVFAGFVLMNDPVKQGIRQTIEQLHSLRVGLKILSGDNRNIARAIGRTIGIKAPVILTGKELANTSPEALRHLMRKVDIFAEIEPQQKERIILSLKKNYTVAYVGDGINDVSAITAADVGISVSNAVDVAREAADFVLTEKNLMVIVDGIREGRKTFANTLKYLYINTGATFGNMCSVAAAALILPFLPMLPKQILLTNFLTDVPFLAVTTDNVDQEQLRRPGKWNFRLIRNYMAIFGIHSSIFDLITFFTLYYLLKAGEHELQTGWFIESVLSELFIVFIIRSHKTFLKSKPGKYLFIFSVVALSITLGLPYSIFAADIGLKPLPLSYITILLTIVLTYTVTADILKVWFFKRHMRD